MDDNQARLEWIEHLSKAADAFVRDLKGILPEETCTHLRGSRKEFLLALRTLIDRQIEKIDRANQTVRRLEVQ